LPLGSALRVCGALARAGARWAVARTITFADGSPLFFIGTEVPDVTEQ
jgi:hypothetical protein